MMSKEPIGSGRRFRGLAGKLAGKRGVKNPEALAAHIGRQKWGAKRFNALANAAKQGQQQNGEKPPETRARARRIKI
jgi:hypothetical protein